VNEHQEAVLHAERAQVSVDRVSQALTRLEEALKAFDTKLGEIK